MLKIGMKDIPGLISLVLLHCCSRLQQESSTRRVLNITSHRLSCRFTIRLVFFITSKQVVTKLVKHCTTRAECIYIYVLRHNSQKFPSAFIHCPSSSPCWCCGRGWRERKRPTPRSSGYSNWKCFHPLVCETFGLWSLHSLQVLKSIA